MKVAVTKELFELPGFKKWWINNGKPTAVNIEKDSSLYTRQEVEVLKSEGYYVRRVKELGNVTLLISRA